MHTNSLTRPPAYTRGYLSIFVVMFFLYSSTTLVFLYTLAIDHLRYQSQYLDYCVAYAAALSGLRMSPTHIADLKTQYHAPSLDDLSKSTPFNTAAINYHLFKTTSHIYSRAQYGTAQCNLQARYSTVNIKNNKKVVISEPSFFYVQ